MRQLAKRADVPPSTMNRLRAGARLRHLRRVPRALPRQHQRAIGRLFARGRTGAGGCARKRIRPRSQCLPAGSGQQYQHLVRPHRPCCPGARGASVDGRPYRPRGRHVRVPLIGRLPLPCGGHGVYATGTHRRRDIDELAHRLGGLKFRGCLVVCIAVEPCAADSIRVARRAQEAGARVIGITDRRTSPLAACSDDILPISVRGPSYFPSRVSATVLVEVLVGMVAARSGSSVSENVDKTNRSRRDLGKYWNE